jgi:hypothetical protein
MKYNLIHKAIADYGILVGAGVAIAVGIAAVVYNRFN